MLGKSTLITFVTSLTSVLAATLSGSATITPQDYYGLPASALANNPPACGMPYNQLNLARITAVQAMDTSSTCNLCLKVVNAKDTSKYIYVLAVDLGGSGLDLSIPAFEYLFDQRYDASPATWSTVDSSYCDGIYTPGVVNTNQGLSAGTSDNYTSISTTTVKTTTTTTTTTIKPATTTTTTFKPTTTTTVKTTTTTVKPTTTTTVKTTTTTVKPTTTTATVKSTTSSKSTTTSKTATTKSTTTNATTTKSNSTRKATTTKSSSTRKSTTTGRPNNGRNRPSRRQNNRRFRARGGRR